MTPTLEQAVEAFVKLINSEGFTDQDAKNLLTDANITQNAGQIWSYIYRNQSSKLKKSDKVRYTLFDKVYYYIRERQMSLTRVPVII